MKKAGTKSGFEKIVKEIRPCGDVLQIGFDLALSEEIQKYSPQAHMVIESDAPLFKEAKKWAEKGKRSALEGSWQDLLNGLGVFDVFFFLDNFCGKEEDREEAASLLKEGKKRVFEVERMFPNLKKMRYSETEVDAFCSQAKGVSDYLSRFLQELEHAGQISSEIRKKMEKKYGLKKEAFSPVKKESSFSLFLEEALRSHVRKGSRFCCLLQRSSLEDQKFFEEISIDPNLEYREVIWKRGGAETFLLYIEKVDAKSF